MKPISLKIKCYMYISLVLISILSLTFLFLYTTNKTNALLDDVLTNPVDEMNDADMLRTWVQKLSVLSHQDKLERQKLITNITKIINHLHEHNNNFIRQYSRDDQLNLKIQNQWLNTIKYAKDDLADRNKFQLGITRLTDLLGKYHHAKVKAISTLFRENKRRADQSANLAISLMLLIVILILALSWVFGRSTMVAISKLRSAMNLFSSGKMDHRIKGQLPIELQDLYLGFNTMAERIEQSYSELREMSIHDELTGALNYRQFNHDLSSELDRSRRYKHNFILFIMDVNNFKEVNDTYGHQAGNEVLKGIVGTIREHMRITDNLYRIGGDELAVILPETDAVGGKLVMQRMNDAIYKRFIDCFDLVSIRTSVSIGMASYPEDGATVEVLNMKADDEMYKAKRCCQKPEEAKQVGL